MIFTVMKSFEYHCRKKAGWFQLIGKNWMNTSDAYETEKYHETNNQTFDERFEESPKFLVRQFLRALPLWFLGSFHAGNVHRM